MINGKQEIDLPLHRQRSAGDRQENRAERQQGVRKRLDRSDRAAWETGARNYSRERDRI
ncbi:MAG: hypothetical protein OEY88_02640 [Candidatus Bathyarchaeota archaeon]|nr:hypothetical protein [Candidatus Bathyarchaeota archaeon]